MFSWGSCSHGQLGLGEIESSFVKQPHLVELPVAGNFEDNKKTADIVEIAAGTNHTVLLHENGSLYSTGSNEYGQLGQKSSKSRFELVSNLESYTIKSVVCGAFHNLAIDEWGRIFTWGMDDHGQLGNNGEFSIQLDCSFICPTPRMIRTISATAFVQVAAGRSHSIALARNGSVYAWGENLYGQLGLGESIEQISWPQKLECLHGMPIRYVAAGENHSVVISLGGAVYVFGANNKFQLGLGDNEKRFYPTQIRSLRSQGVVYCSCGDEHTVVLTRDGGVFSFGDSGYGQLGHSTNKPEIVPRKIAELMGMEVSQISCGRNYTLAFVPSQGRLYAFGIGSMGQLGGMTIVDANSPQIVSGPWSNPFSSKSSDNPIYLRLVACGGDSSFVTFSTSPAHSFKPIDCRSLPDHKRMSVLTMDLIHQMKAISSEQAVDQDFMVDLETIFNSASCLNGSMLHSPADFIPFSSRYSGVDISAWKWVTSMLANLSNESIISLVNYSLIEMLNVKSLFTSGSVCDVEALRIFLFMPLFHHFEHTNEFLWKINVPFFVAISKLSKSASSALEHWIIAASLPESKWYFARYVQIINSTVSRILENSKAWQDLEMVLQVMALFNRINIEQNLIIPHQNFVVPSVLTAINLPMAYVKWIAAQRNQFDVNEQFFICNFPFIFDTKSKTILLQVDQALQMSSSSGASSFPMSLLNISVEMTQYLFLNVSRNNLVDDTFSQLQSLLTTDLKKPLRVEFVGEVAEDGGGVRKEFFLLLTREILSSKYGMFKEYPETSSIWFNPFSFEDDSMYLLIGLVCGLAIYNQIIIDIHFPLTLYKKLLLPTANNPVVKCGLTTQELAELMPGVAKNMQQMIEYEEDDFDEVFGLDFSVTEDTFGQIKNVILKSDETGAPMLVTRENRVEYVKLYCDYIFNSSVSNKFYAFYKGFHQVCGGRVLELFQPHELMELVAGNENYDWQALEAQASYKNGYTRDHPTIENFWKVFHELNEKKKRKFLLFLTGSDRVPVLGMTALAITIQKIANTDSLPVAHTCFNLLDLPAYATKEKLKYKLLISIEFNEGFGLV